MALDSQDQSLPSPSLFDLLDFDFTTRDESSSRPTTATSTSLRSLYDFDTPLARIEVGNSSDESQSRVFYIESNVWTLSPYLKAAFEGNFIESASKTIHLPEDDPEQVGLYLHWLGSGFDESPNTYCRVDHLSVETKKDFLRLPVNWVFDGDMASYRVCLLESDMEFAETYTFARRIGDTDYALAVAERFLNTGIKKQVTWLSPAAINQFWDQTPEYLLSGLRRALTHMCKAHYLQMVHWIGEEKIRTSVRTPILEYRGRPYTKAHHGRGATHLMATVLEQNGYCQEFCDDLLACCISGYYPRHCPVTGAVSDSDTYRRIEMLRGERVW